MNKTKARNAVEAVFGKAITVNNAYHKIYDMSEHEFRLESVAFAEMIQSMINKAAFAGMEQELQALTAAWEQYNENERYFASHF
jgi:phage host-nuclease inhibitor protein Gam